MEFKLTLLPEAGPYKNGRFEFDIIFSDMYPFHAPKMRCKTPIWHPNIHLDTGEVKSGFLHTHWTPVLTLDTVIHSLQLLFLEPDLDCSINADCTNIMTNNRSLFLEQVRGSMEGGVYFGKLFPDHKFNQSVLSNGKRRLNPVDSLDYLPQPKRSKVSPSTQILSASALGLKTGIHMDNTAMEIKLNNSKSINMNTNLFELDSTVGYNLKRGRIESPLVSEDISVFYHI